ncbi:hypothetical protein H0H81_010038 [Sphagnurus paluster]|uniref:Outer kinetochore protein DAD2 n=1 Tax=Sphagnurus paluster TaxID=117069 RepID=A0A9P7FXB9_9AGAR|nr:hypothetical protein H0H81_010038 [Sphagnurus paluster]
MRQSVTVNRASHGGLLNSQANSSAAAIKLLEKKKEFDAVSALEHASALYLERIEGLGEDCEVMADAGQAHGQVLEQWPKMFEILSLFSQWPLEVLKLKTRLQRDTHMETTTVVNDCVHEGRVEHKTPERRSYAEALSPKATSAAHLQKAWQATTTSPLAPKTSSSPEGVGPDGTAGAPSGDLMDAERPEPTAPFMPTPRKSVTPALKETATPTSPSKAVKVSLANGKIPC